MRSLAPFETVIADHRCHTRAGICDRGKYEKQIGSCSKFLEKAKGQQHQNDSDHRTSCSDSLDSDKNLDMLRWEGRSSMMLRMSLHFDVWWGQSLGVDDAKKRGGQALAPQENVNKHKRGKRRGVELKRGRRCCELNTVDLHTEGALGDCDRVGSCHQWQVEGGGLVPSTLNHSVSEEVPRIGHGMVFLR